MRADSTHCEHGTYIGYPGGADYLCQWCEDGISLAEMVDIKLEQAHNRMLREAEILNAMHDAIFVTPNSMTDMVKRETWQHVADTYIYR